MYGSHPQHVVVGARQLACVARWGRHQVGLGAVTSYGGQQAVAGAHLARHTQHRRTPCRTVRPQIPPGAARTRLGVGPHGGDQEVRRTSPAAHPDLAGRRSGAPPAPVAGVPVRGQARAGPHRAEGTRHRIAGRRGRGGGPTPRGPGRGRRARRRLRVLSPRGPGKSGGAPARTRLRRAGAAAHGGVRTRSWPRRPRTRGPRGPLRHRRGQARRGIGRAHHPGKDQGREQRRRDQQPPAPAPRQVLRALLGLLRVLLPGLQEILLPAPPPPHDRTAPRRPPTAARRPPPERQSMVAEPPLSGEGAYPGPRFHGPDSRARASVRARKIATSGSGSLRRTAR